MLWNVWPQIVSCYKDAVKCLTKYCHIHNSKLWAARAHTHTRVNIRNGSENILEGSRSYRLMSYSANPHTPGPDPWDALSAAVDCIRSQTSWIGILANKGCQMVEGDGGGMLSEKLMKVLPKKQGSFAPTHERLGPCLTSAPCSLPVPGPTPEVNEDRRTLSARALTEFQCKRNSRHPSSLYLDPQLGLSSDRGRGWKFWNFGKASCCWWEYALREPCRSGGQQEK